MRVSFGAAICLLFACPVMLSSPQSLACSRIQWLNRRRKSAKCPRQPSIWMPHERSNRTASHCRRLVDRSCCARMLPASPCSRSTGRRRATACPRRCCEALGDALTAIAHERTVRAVVLAANGPAFSAGHDLKELNARRSDADRGRAYFKHIMGLCSAVMQQIVMLPQPVIAAVQATATAAGCQLVASCDLAVASQHRQIRHARRQYRPVLLDADGRAVAQRLAQARDGNAADRRTDLGRGCRAHRPRQPRGRARQRARGSAQARGKDRRQIGADRQDRQGGVLSPGSKCRSPRPTTMRPK